MADEVRVAVGPAGDVGEILVSSAPPSRTGEVSKKHAELVPCETWASAITLLVKPGVAFQPDYVILSGAKVWLERKGFENECTCGS